MKDNSTFRHYIHYIISIYLVFGGVLTNDKTLLYIHFYVTFLTVIHWFTNNGQCFLSEMDYDVKEEPNGYTKHLLEKMGIPYTKGFLIFMGYASVLVPCLYSLYKLNKMDIRPYLII